MESTDFKLLRYGSKVSLREIVLFCLRHRQRSRWLKRGASDHCASGAPQIATGLVYTMDSCNCPAPCSLQEGDLQLGYQDSSRSGSH
jgi:hypothetical protein